MKYRQILLALLAGALLVIGFPVLMAYLTTQPMQVRDAYALPQDSGFEAVSITPEGDDGSAVATVTSTARLWGYIKGIYVDYGASISETTDLTITTAAPAATVMILTDVYTDGWYYPSVQFSDAAGAAVSGAYGRFPVYNNLVIQEAETTSDTETVVYVYWGQ